MLGEPRRIAADPPLTIRIHHVIKATTAYPVSCGPCGNSACGMN